MQSDITQLKSDLSKQYQTIELLKASHGEPQTPIIPTLTKADITALLSKVKEVCDDALRQNFELPPGWHTAKKEFEKYQQIADKKFLPFETFQSS